MGFNISLVCGVEESADVALLMHVQVSLQCIVCNDWAAGEWGREEIDMAQLRDGDDFVAIIQCGPTAYEISINGMDVCDFQYRSTSLRSVMYVGVEGDVILRNIIVEGDPNQATVDCCGRGPRHQQVCADTSRQQYAGVNTAAGTGSSTGRDRYRQQGRSTDTSAACSTSVVQSATSPYHPSEAIIQVWDTDDPRNQLMSASVSEGAPVVAPSSGQEGNDVGTGSSQWKCPTCPDPEDSALSDAAKDAINRSINAAVFISNRNKINGEADNATSAENDEVIDLCQRPYNRDLPVETAVIDNNAFTEELENPDRNEKPGINPDGNEKPGINKDESPSGETAVTKDGSVGSDPAKERSGAKDRSPGEADEDGDARNRSPDDAETMKEASTTAAPAKRDASSYVVSPQQGGSSFKLVPAAAPSPPPEAPDAPPCPMMVEEEDCSNVIQLPTKKEQRADSDSVTGTDAGLGPRATSKNKLNQNIPPSTKPEKDKEHYIRVGLAATIVGLVFMGFLAATLPYKFD